MTNAALAALRHHVTGTIERGEGTAIVERPAHWHGVDLPHAPGELNVAAGVQPWSNPEQYVIFSVKSDYVVNGNHYRRLPRGGAEGLEDWFAGVSPTAYRGGIPYKALEGSYKGKREPSWIINARDWRRLADSGWIDQEESVLHLGAWEGGGRPATLWYREFPAAGESRAVPIGKFHQEGRAYAVQQDAWTLDPSTGEYYTCD